MLKTAFRLLCPAAILLGAASLGGCQTSKCQTCAPAAHQGSQPDGKVHGTAGVRMGSRDMSSAAPSSRF